MEDTAGQETAENIEELKLETEEVVEAAEAETNVDEEKENLSIELDQAKAKVLYIAAEMENLKKRTQREKEQALKFGQEKMLKSLVDVVDNFDRTVDALRLDEDEKIKNIVFGIDMIRKQFIDTLKDNGLELVECNGEFDPNFHEAFGQEEDEEKQTNEILKVIQQGYVLNGRLLRAAKVIIVK